MFDRARLVSNALATLGAILGGVAGYALFFWIARQGFYAMIVPGAMLGLGCGLLARHRSWTRGLVCGVAGLLLGLYAEWQFAPFQENEGFVFMVTHLTDKVPMKPLMIGVGTLMAAWLGKDAGYSGILPGRGSKA